MNAFTKGGNQQYYYNDSLRLQLHLLKSSIHLGFANHAAQYFIGVPPEVNRDCEATISILQ